MAEVGRGGAGVVYQATAPDGRQVALKLLATRSSSTSSRRRFLREVQALLRVRHENLLPVLDAGELAGIPWLVLPWVEGETLGARLHREGPLGLDEAARLVQQLAGALEHCHAMGVLHRDLKPENVLLEAEGGAPRLVDFGLAKDLSETDSVTCEGAILGTPGYWPPEQARGDLAAVGPRSDVYGLGALLYAALTGQPPAAGMTILTLLAGSERAPLAPSHVRPQVPPELDAVCVRCLAMDPAARYGGPGEVADALGRWLARGPSRRSRRRLALLAGAGTGLVVGGLLVALGQAALAASGSRLSPVAAPTASPAPSSARAALQAGASPATPALDAPRTALLRIEEAEQRQAAGDVAGSERLCAEALTLDPGCAAAHLVRARARVARGELLAALDDLDRAVELAPRDVRSLQQRGALRARLGELEGALVDCTRAIELGGREAELFGQRGMLRYGQDDYLGAIEDFSRAVELEPEDPRGWLRRGQARFELDDLQRASTDLSRAIELDPLQPEAYLARGMVRQGLGDHRGAEEDLTRAIELRPDDAEAHHQRGDLRAGTGQVERGLEDLARAIQLEPEHVAALSCRAAIRLRQGDAHGALADAERALELDRDDPELLALCGDCRARVGDAAGATRDYQRALAALPPGARRPGGLDVQVRLALAQVGGVAARGTPEER